MKSDSDFLKRNAEKIIAAYNAGSSVPDLAKEYGTYPLKICRLIRASGGRLRTKSESQKLALETGRAIHPTNGPHFTEEKREQLSEKMHSIYSSFPEEKKKRISEKCRESYHSRSDEEKENLRVLSHAAILRAAREGSKMEHFFFDKLTEEGYTIVFHKKGFILNDNLEIDLLIPSLKVAIEVDGIYHYEDIHGDLKKVSRKDDEKNGLLLAAGYVVIRILNDLQNTSLYGLKQKYEVLSAKLQEIKANFPPVGERLIFLK